MKDAILKLNKGAFSKFKRYVDKYDKVNVVLDLSDWNIIDAAKILVQAQTYSYQKHPGKKLKCVVPSYDIKTFIPDVLVKNLELSVN